MLLFKVLIINFSILTSVAVSFTAFKSVAFKKWRAFIICSIFFSTQEQEYTNSLVHLEGVKLGLLIFPHSSGGKESICNAGNLGLISWVRKIPQGRDRPRTAVFVGFPGGSGNKESTSNAGDWSSITGLGRCSSPGGHGNPSLSSCLENPHGAGSLAGCGPWGGKVSDTTEQLSTYLPIFSEPNNSGPLKATQAKG